MSATQDYILYTFKAEKHMHSNSPLFFMGLNCSLKLSAEPGDATEDSAATRDRRTHDGILPSHSIAAGRSQPSILEAGHGSDPVWLCITQQTCSLLAKLSRGSA